MHIKCAKVDKECSNSWAGPFSKISQGLKNSKFKKEWLDKRYTYRVLQTIQIKLIHLYVWADQVVLGSAKTALKFEYEI